MKLPMKFETASKVAYLVFAGGGGLAILMMAAYLVAARAGVPQSAFLSLAGGILGAVWLGLGADGLDRYWKRRHDEEMLKEVDRLQSPPIQVIGGPEDGDALEAAIRRQAANRKTITDQAGQAGLASAGAVLQEAATQARKAITDWEDRRR